MHGLHQHSAWPRTDSQQMLVPSESLAGLPSSLPFFFSHSHSFLCLYPLPFSLLAATSCAPELSATTKALGLHTLLSSWGWCPAQPGQWLEPFLRVFLPLHRRPCHSRSLQSKVWRKPWGGKMSATLMIKTSPRECSSKPLQEVLVPELGLLQHRLFGDNTIVVKSAFESVCIRPREPELRKHQLGWHSSYFFHVPLVNSLKVRWLILCLTRKDGSFSQMLLSAESELVHSPRESLNHRLLAGRQTLADSHLWPTMKHHLLRLGEERLQQMRATVQPSPVLTPGGQ